MKMAELLSLNVCQFTLIVTLSKGFFAVFFFVIDVLQQVVVTQYWYLYVKLPTEKSLLAWPFIATFYSYLIRFQRHNYMDSIYLNPYSTNYHCSRRHS